MAKISSLRTTLRSHTRVVQPVARYFSDQFCVKPNVVMGVYEICFISGKFAFESVYDKATTLPI